MLHETTIHRVDVQRAAGGAPEVDAGVAVDGIDEILANLPHAAYFAPHLDDLRGDGETVCLEPTDRPTGWLVRLWPQGYYWERRRADADAMASGTVADLLLLVYNRGPASDDRLRVDGDAVLLARVLRGFAL
jgi:hypothetical protein